MMDENYVSEHYSTEFKKETKEKQKNKDQKMLNLLFENLENKRVSVVKPKSISIEEQYEQLLTFKSQIKDLEIICSKIITDELSLIKKIKFKELLKLEMGNKNSLFVFGLVGCFSGVLLYNAYNIVRSLFFGSFDIGWGIASLCIGVLGLGFLGNALVREMLKNNVLNKNKENIIQNVEINSENLMKVSLFLNEQDKNYLTKENHKNEKVLLKNIINIINVKKEWVSNNEDDIIKKMKINQNKSIINS